MAFGSCDPSGILLCDNLCPAFFFLCNLFLSVSNLCCRLGFFRSLHNLLHLNLHLMFSVLRLPSLQSSWLHQRSGIVDLFAASPVVYVSHPFSTSYALCCVTTDTSRILPLCLCEAYASACSRKCGQQCRWTAPGASPLFSVNGLGCWNFPLYHHEHIDLFVGVLLLKNLDVLGKLVDLCLFDRCRIQAPYSALS